MIQVNRQINISILRRLARSDYAPNAILIEEPVFYYHRDRTATLNQIMHSLQHRGYVNQEAWDSTCWSITPAGRMYLQEFDKKFKQEFEKCQTTP